MNDDYQPWSWENFCRDVDHGDLVRIVLAAGSFAGYICRGTTDYDTPHGEEIPLFSLHLYDPVAFPDHGFPLMGVAYLDEDGHLETEGVCADESMIGYEILKKRKP